MFNKTQYKLLIEEYMKKYDVSYITAKKELCVLHKIDESTTDDTVSNLNISML